LTFWQNVKHYLHPQSEEKENEYKRQLVYFFQGVA